MPVEPKEVSLAMLIDASQKEDGLCSQHLIETTNATAAAATTVEDSAAKLDPAEIDPVEVDLVA